VKPAPVVAIALNTRDCSDDEARAHLEAARAETGLPCDDVVRNGPHALYDAIRARAAQDHGAAMRKLLAWVAFALLLSGCAKVDQTSTGGRHPWTRPGHLIIRNAGEEPDTLNKLFANTDAAIRSRSSCSNRCSATVRGGEYLPAAATVVPTLQNGGIAAGGKTITLHIRRRHAWSDGAAVRRARSRLHLEGVMNPRNNTRLTPAWTTSPRWSCATRTPSSSPQASRTAESWASSRVGGAGYPPAHRADK